MVTPVKLIEADLNSLGEVDLAARLVLRLAQLGKESDRKIPNRNLIVIIQDDIADIQVLAKNRGYDLPDESS